MARVATILCAALLAVLPAALADYPRASERPIRWQLTLDTGDLRFHRDSQDGQGYWVLVYEVINETDEDLLWAPSFDLVTDRGEVLAEGEDVPRRVHLEMLEILGDPLLAAQSATIGTILRGPEHAKRGLVVWQAKREDVRQVQIFVRGASGDTASVVHPVSGEAVVLHRDLQLGWSVPGTLDELLLEALPRRPIGAGVSSRGVPADEADTSAAELALRRWVYR